MPNKTRTLDINALLRKNPRVSRRGAPMGDPGFYDGSIYLHLQRVVLVDGDYGPDGTYWGGGRGTLPLWCAFNAANAEHTPAHGTRLYARARSRDEAKTEILKQYVNVRFYR